MKKLVHKKKIKSAVIGLGVGMHHVKTLSTHPNSELLWICDIDKNKIKETNKAFNKIKKTKTDQDILNDPEVDLVCICSYDEDHYRQVVQALDNNKHVFVEKPMCLTNKEAKNIRNILNAKPYLQLSSNMVLRSCPLFIEVRKKIKEKKMGDIYCLEADYLWGRKEKLISGWRANANSYSIVSGAAIHMIDLAVWLIGKKPIKIQALANNITTKQTKFKFNDFSTLLLEFKDHTVVKIAAHGGCVHPHFHSLKVFGKNLSFIHDITASIWINSVNPKKKFKSEPAEYPAKTQRNKVLKSFIDAISKNQENFLVTREEVFAVTSICLAADEAIKSGKKIIINYI
jgi:predicted dehydrogenase